MLVVEGRGRVDFCAACKSSALCLNINVLSVHLREHGPHTCITLIQAMIILTATLIINMGDFTITHTFYCCYLARNSI